MQKPIDLKALNDFLDRAGRATYAGGGKYEEIPERLGFYELTFSEGNLSYRDSYTGFYRSRGMEVVRKDGIPVWTSLYGGGMVEGKEKLAHKTFEFLKKALRIDEGDFIRGPSYLKDGDWEYKYTQEGNIEEFNGHEEIYFKGELIFFHRVIGGLVIDKQ